MEIWLQCSDCEAMTEVRVIDILESKKWKCYACSKETNLNNDLRDEILVTMIYHIQNLESIVRSGADEY